MRVPSLVRAFCAILACAVLCVASPAHATGDPALTTPAAVLDAALTCPSSFTHPSHEPVLLVQGTGVDAESNWWPFANALRAQGYDVCWVDLPGNSWTDIQLSTEYVVSAVNRVRAATGRKVDLVTHSQGALEARWAARWWPSTRDKIDDLVLLAPPNHGISGGNLFCVIPCAEAATQLRLGSDFIDALNSGDETPGTISTTSMISVTDEGIIPFTTAPLSGAKNILVQDVCPGRLVGHVGMVLDSVVFRLTVDALSHSGPADPGRLPFGKCLDAYLPGVGPVTATAFSADVVAQFAATLLTAPKVWAEPALRPYTQP